MTVTVSAGYKLARLYGMFLPFSDDGRCQPARRICLVPSNLSRPDLDPVLPNSSIPKSGLLRDLLSCPSRVDDDTRISRQS